MNNNFQNKLLLIKLIINYLNKIITNKELMLHYYLYKRKRK